MAHRGWKRDGFTPAKKAKAVEALGKYGNVADAARVAGVSDTTFYKHLNKDAEFARLCETARAQAGKPLETLAWQRAVEGAPETIIRKGEVVQVKIKPSDSLMRLILQASNPKKYGRLSRGGASRRQIERRVRLSIEKELRPIIEAEVRSEIAARDAEATANAKSLFDQLSERVAEVRRERERKAAAARGEGKEAA